jgi:alpha-maltose-1-phosphate synthase
MIDPAMIHRQSANRPAVLLSHPTGNQNVRNALLSLVEHEMLAEFWTTIAWNPDSFWNRLLPAGLKRQLARREFSEAPWDQIRCVPAREAVRLGAGPTFLGRYLYAAERPFSIIGMYRHFDGRVAQRLKTVRPGAVYAYEGGALNTFREARRLGIPTLYELPSSYWYWEHQLLSDEAAKNPEFAGLLPKLEDSPGHMRWKDEELALADYVFVPSEHVARTLDGVVARKKIRVVNYGAPAIRERKRVAGDSRQPLKVLFVGSLIQRKGIGYLLEAVDRLGDDVELTLVGRRFRANSRVDAACSRWHWFESLPHPAVLDLMMKADVLVLPSLTEGCALSVLEALACGLPVIVTPNTGSLEFVSDGREGFVVPICDADAIADRLYLIHRDRELLASMSARAQATAAKKSWDDYRAKWGEAVRAAI